METPNRKIKSLEDLLSNERKISESLRMADEYIRNIFMQVPVAIVIYKGSSFIVDLINEKALEIWGQDLKNVIHKPLFEFSPELRESHEKLLTDVFITGKPFFGTEVVTRFKKNGSLQECFFNFVLQPVNDLNGTIIGVVSVATDVTQEVRSRIKIEESEKHLQLLNQELAKELSAAEKLHHISTILIQKENISELYPQIINAAVELMNSDMASMQVYHPETGVLELLADKDFHPETRKHYQTVSIECSSTCGQALKGGERKFMPDIEMDKTMAGTRDLYFSRLSGIRSVQSTPLISRTGELLGMISTHWRQPHHPTERDLHLFDVLARQVADLFEQRSAVKNNEKHEEQIILLNRQLEAELAALRELQQQSNYLLVNGEDEKTMYDKLLDACIQLMQSDCASLQLYHPQSQTLKLIAHKNFHPGSATFWETVTAASGSVCGEALRKGSRIAVNDIENEEFAAGELDIFRLSGIRAVQCTPLISRKGTMIGMISTQWKTPRSFTENDFRYFNLLSRQAVDLLEQRTAQKKNEENEKRYRLLTEATAAVVWNTTAEGELIPPQPSFEKYTGQTEKEYKNGGWALMIHPDDREFVKRLWQEAIAEKKFYHSWGRIWSAQHQDWRYYESNGIPYVNDDGEIIEWIGIIHDVHDKVMEQKKEEHKIKMQALEFEQAVEERTAQIKQELKELKEKYQEA